MTPMRSLRRLLAPLTRRAAGGAIPPYSLGGELGGSVPCMMLGPCPLDGYPLVEFLPPLGGGVEHVIPAEQIPDFDGARARIAQAHAHEVVAHAEQIIREES